MPNQYLKVSSDRYPKELDSALIHPISTIDAEIAVELGQIFKKAHLEAVKAIWDKYKFYKDSQVRDQLLQWNIDHPEVPDVFEDEDDSTGKAKKKIRGLLDIIETKTFIMLKDLRINLSFIRTYEKRQEFNFVKETMQYFITINELPDTTGVTNATTNKEILYTDFEQRDHDFALLDQAMRDSGNIKFVNDQI